MIIIVFSEGKLYLNLKEKILKYEIDSLELDLEEIIEDNDIKNKEIIIVLDYHIDDIEYYIKLFNAFELRIKYIYNIKDILIEENKELIYISNDNYVYINNSEIKILDISNEDNIDLTGILNFELDKDIEHLFNLVKRTKIDSLYKKQYFKKEYIIYLSIIIVLFNYYISNLIFENNSHKNYQLKLKNELKIITTKMENKKIELDRLKTIRPEISFRKDIKKGELSKRVDKYIKLSKKYFYFYTIDIDINEEHIKGICKNLEVLNNNIKEYEIIELKKLKNYLYFNLKIKRSENIER